MGFTLPIELAHPMSALGRPIQRRFQSLLDQPLSDPFHRARAHTAGLADPVIFPTYTTLAYIGHQQYLGVQPFIPRYFPCLDQGVQIRPFLIVKTDDILLSRHAELHRSIDLNMAAIIPDKKTWDVY